MKLNVKKLEERVLKAQYGVSLIKKPTKQNTGTLTSIQPLWQQSKIPHYESPYNLLNKQMESSIDYDFLIPKIIKHEGAKKDAQGNHIVYKDGKKIDTIGYGLTDKRYISKGKLTEEEAMQGLTEHIDKEVLPHLQNKPYWSKLNSNQKHALISYVYNIGSGNFNVKSPSLQKALNEGNWKEAAKQMDFGYNDKKNPGLRRRRDEERALFLS